MSDLSDTLPSFHDLQQPKCGMQLNGGACMYKPACHEKCMFLEEAAKPSSPFSCRALTDEERDRGAYCTSGEIEEQRDREEQDMHPERFL